MEDRVTKHYTTLQKDPRIKNPGVFCFSSVNIQVTRTWLCTINMERTGGLPDEIYGDNVESIKVAYKANWYLLTLNQNRTHSVTVCFIRHILKSV